MLIKEAIIALAYISGFAFPYFMIKAILEEYNAKYIILSCISFGIIVFTIIKTISVAL